MELGIGMEVRSVTCGDIKKFDEIDALRFGDGVQTLMSVPTTEPGSSSFTALLELPPNQAVQLLHSPGTETTAAAVTETPGNEAYLLAPIFLSSTVFLDGATKYSVFAATETSPTCSIPVKEEPADTDSQPDSSPVVSDPVLSKSTKRKEREKKVKATAKKNKPTANDFKEDADKLPYVHVRARRGQATDSHSLAERARREKINARMKLLQDLVPGCNKISGTSMVLDEIINHVQSLQRQVEFLSMRLAAVNPRIDINLDSLFAAESESLMNCNLPDMVMPSMWQEIQHNGNRQLYKQLWHFDGPHQPGWNQPGWVREEGNPKFLTTENSLLTYDNSVNSASLHTNHELKMEL